MKSYKELSEADRSSLLKFPAYVSLLAANAEGAMDAITKKAVIKLTHIKTFSSEPLLLDFFKEAESVFEKNIDDLDHSLSKGKTERDAEIRLALSKNEAILLKLGREYARAIHQSMKSYIDHVAHAHRNVLEYFIFPLPISGITS